MHHIVMNPGSKSRLDQSASPRPANFFVGPIIFCKPSYKTENIDILEIDPLELNFSVVLDKIFILMCNAIGFGT